EHKMIRDAAREFAQELKTGVIERDELAKFPFEFVKQMGELGFMGIMTPEQYGGAGLDTLAYVLVLEEISKIDASAAVIVSAHNSLVLWGLNEYGSEEQKQKYLRSEEHTSELQSRENLVCRLLLEKKKKSEKKIY